MTWPAKFGEWTKISEGLPQSGDNVIICLSDDEVAGAWYCNYASPSFFEGRYGGHPFKTSRVLAWMPMPAAPSASPERGPGPS